jgi:predicted ester cyclase
MQKAKTVLFFMFFVIAFTAVIIGCRDREKAVEEENKALLQQIFEEGINMHDPDAWDDVLASNYVRHCQAMPPEKQEIHGLEDMKAFLKETFITFPDWHEEIQFMVAERDKIACISIGTGTQSGPMGELPPSGKKIEVVNFIIHRFENGKVAETWITWDNLDVLRQLGFFPPPEEKKSE